MPTPVRQLQRQIEYARVVLEATEDTAARVEILELIAQAEEELRSYVSGRATPHLVYVR
jgi:hypothetical protein